MLPSETPTYINPWRGDSTYHRIDGSRQSWRFGDGLGRDNDIAASFGEVERELPPDASRSTSDHRDLPGENRRHCWNSIQINLLRNKEYRREVLLN